MECFTLKISYKAKMLTFSTVISHSARSSSQCNKARKGNKRHTEWKERKWSLFAVDMIINKENPKDAQKKKDN